MKTILMPDYEAFSNAAKGAMIGEFSERVEITCSECEGDGLGPASPHCEGESTCEQCGGSGTVWQRVPVSWTTIKAIYKRATDLFAPQEENRDATP
ncbi:hypothetical protein [Tanticharoenia sakaeratensis]|uniref:Uncharacterized protein n=1 Tax=Tanticharoenia sakaeratensis NBRC 103193 TaxID=1231623 RepID=A0A0D6MP74_9PROT|nr:hypothetical protein [Tanticharoenia sakaeratensis]GAN55210.1 hypothetical protein Tasa_041_005 [Tanticharoenia sakaeratensis NBRC 103193]GBQ23247.1 hypothetical protein AA103193_2348 [Tanticharoenia sakaeratensis NBRC 103193]